MFNKKWLVQTSLSISWYLRVTFMYYEPVTQLSATIWGIKSSCFRQSLSVVVYHGLSEVLAYPTILCFTEQQCSTRSHSVIHLKSRSLFNLVLFSIRWSSLYWQIVPFWSGNKVFCSQVPHEGRNISSQLPRASRRSLPHVWAHIFKCQLHWISLFL